MASADDGRSIGPRRHARRSPAGVLRAFLVWLGTMLALHLAWELAQLPLYTLARTGSAAEIAWAVAHCTAGDGLISAAAYAVTALLLRCWKWPWDAASAGVPLFLVVGVAYTGFSEWRNVYQLGSWSYAAAMPTVFGIGLAPLAQWTLVPLIAVAWVRRARAGVAD